MVKLKLKRLKIHQFRNVAPGTELSFRDSFNVVLGKNGTGKTTLLNLIVSILSWNFEPLLGEPLALEYELETAGWSATIRLRNELFAKAKTLGPEAQAGSGELFEGAMLVVADRYETSGEIYLSGLESLPEWKVSFHGSRLSLSKGDGSATLQWDSQEPIAGIQTLQNIWRHLAQLQPDELQTYGAVVGRMVLLGPSDILKLMRFDESLGYLNHLTRSEKVVTVQRIASERFVYRAMAWDATPRSVTQRILRQVKESPDSDEVSDEADQDEKGFLGRAIKLLGVQSIKIRLLRIARRMDPVESVDFGNLRFDLTRQDRSVINHAVLSYGQKRLLSFYYYLACYPACVVADELVNGMHHEWIEACLEDLGERQSFLTSQNPLLLDYLGFESAEEVRSSFVLCHAEVQGDREILRWENMTPEDAEGFFRAYQVGIQHVSEILRTRGLW